MQSSDVWEGFDTVRTGYPVITLAVMLLYMSRRITSTYLLSLL